MERPCAWPTLYLEINGNDKIFQYITMSKDISAYSSESIWNYRQSTCATIKEFEKKMIEPK